MIEVEILEEIDLFAGLSADVLEVLRHNMRPFDLEAGEVLIDQGARSTGPLFLISEGLLEITRVDDAGNKHTVALLEAPTVVGEMEFLCETTYSATVTALDDAVGAVLSRRQFEELIARSEPAAFQLALAIGRAVSERFAAAYGSLPRAAGRAAAPPPTGGATADDGQALEIGRSPPEPPPSDDTWEEAGVGLRTARAALPDGPSPPSPPSEETEAGEQPREALLTDLAPRNDSDSESSLDAGNSPESSLDAGNGPDSELDAGNGPEPDLDFDLGSASELDDPASDPAMRTNDVFDEAIDSTTDALQRTHRHVANAMDNENEEVPATPAAHRSLGEVDAELDDLLNL